MGTYIHADGARLLTACQCSLVTTHQCSSLRSKPEPQGRRVDLHQVTHMCTQPVSAFLPQTHVPRTPHLGPRVHVELHSLASTQRNFFIRFLHLSFLLLIEVVCVSALFSLLNYKFSKVRIHVWVSVYTTQRVAYCWYLIMRLSGCRHTEWGGQKEGRMDIQSGPDKLLTCGAGFLASF